jgi:hypothetical protein
MPVKRPGDGRAAEIEQIDSSGDETEESEVKIEQIDSSGDETEEPEVKIEQMDSCDETEEPEVKIEQMDSCDETERREVKIEQIDSGEETTNSTNARKRCQETEQKVVHRLRKCIVDYLNYIGEDRGFFPDDIGDIAEAMGQWSQTHCLLTECQSNWSRVRHVFVGSSHAGDLVKNPFPVLRKCPPYNMAAGLLPYQSKQQLDLTPTVESIRMGLNMEDIIRASHVSLFSKPLKTSKPGQVVSTDSMVGMACTGDIELLDEQGDIVYLLEVKTLYRARVPIGLGIPSNAKAAKLYVRDILANHGEFSLVTGNGGNIFRQKSRLVDLEMLRLFGRSHMNALRNRFAVHAHVQPELLLDCCMPRADACVNLYFYEDGDTSGNPAQTFPMLTSELGLTINPWCATTWQMLLQRCVYESCSCKTIIKDDSWMHLLLVVPYNTDVDKPEPYLIMDMPVYFSDGLCKQFERFYVESVCNYTGLSTRKINSVI